MTDYSRLYNFTVKDGLTTGDPAKTIKGVEVDGELDAAATASATKIDKPAAPNPLDLLQFIGGTWDSAAASDVFGGITVLHDEDLAGLPSLTMTGLTANKWYIIICSNFRPQGNVTRFEFRVTDAGVPVAGATDYSNSRMFYSQATSPGVPEAASGDYTADSVKWPEEPTGPLPDPQCSALFFVMGLGDDVNTSFIGFSNNPEATEINIQANDVFSAKVHDGIYVAPLVGTWETAGAPRITILEVSISA